MALLTREQIEKLGFESVGANVLISDRASFYGCGRISLGSHVRIDDFCVLSAGEGGIAIGSYIHIAVCSSLIGAGRIVLADFCNVSSRVAIYSSSDDFSGQTMTNPMVPREYRGVTDAEVNMGRHVIIGTGAVVLPGVSLEEGVAVGALSLVKSSCRAFGIYAGVPAELVGERSRRFLDLEQELRSGCYIQGAR